MRISLDLDDTLIPHLPTVPRELAGPIVVRRILGESLRLGTRELLRGLEARHCEVWLYTSSLRHPLRLWLWFRLLGTSLGGVVNADRHDSELRTRWAGSFPGALPSKYPPAFGIDLHVDDSAGVEAEGRHHGFAVCRVAPESSTWVTEVLDAVDAAVSLQRSQGHGESE